MSTIEYIRGDLIASDEKFIAHGCNTWGMMGAGIAKAIAEQYPTVLKDYQTACAGKRFRLGQIQMCEVRDWKSNNEGDNQRGDNGYRFVLNMATQVEPGPFAQYGAIMQTFEIALSTMSLWKQKRLGVPKIGCGIGGLQWDTVEWIIKELQASIEGSPDVAVYYL